MKSKEELKKILNQGSQIQHEQSSLDDLMQQRMSRFIQNEYDDALQRLGEWGELDQKLTQRCQDNPEVIETLSVDDLKKVIHYHMRFNNMDEDLNQLRYIFERLDKSKDYKRFLDTDLAFENSIVYLLNNDLDRARYSIVQSDNYFVTKWTQLTQGNNQLLSSDLKHKHLECL